jgi:GMP synthase-like glutamine amidotransferase
MENSNYLRQNKLFDLTTMEPVYIFRHIACEGPGYLRAFLERHDIPYHIIAIDEGDAVPTSTAGMSGLVFMGGTMSVNDALPWINDEIELIRQAQHHALPVLGHCLGGQLIAKALGSKVYSNPVKEIGWYDVTQAGIASPWLDELPERFEVFHWHGETFALPPDAVRLFKSKYCRNQGFVHGAMLALQFHVEMTAEMVKKWADLNRQELANTSSSVQSYESVINEADKRTARLNAVAEILYGRWLALVLNKESRI